MRFLFSFIVLFSLFIKAEENVVIASVKKVNGDGAFFIINGQKIAIKSGYEIREKNSLILTEKSSNVLLIWHNGSAIVIGENSQLKINDEDTLEQENGEVYYATKIFNPLNKINSNSYKIKIKTAIIGIRGTEFIINRSDKTKVQLNSGNLTIVPTIQEFEVYKKKTQKEFENFKKGFDNYLNQMNDEFNKYKENQWELSHKTKQLDLNKNSSIVIDNNKIYKDEISNVDLAKFVHYKNIIDQ